VLLGKNIAIDILERVGWGCSRLDGRDRLVRVAAQRLPEKGRNLSQWV
jgi:hypothetical protein